MEYLLIYAALVILIILFVAGATKKEKVFTDVN